MAALSLEPGPVPVRVLLIEDDLDLGGGMVALLAGSGHQVVWARSAADARSVIGGAPVDLVLLDLGLPDGDGADLCAVLRARHPQVVLVVITARAAEADAVRVLDEGADDVVLKPFRPAELLARLRAHLRRRDLSVTPALTVGPIRLDEGARRAWVGEGEIGLRPKELELLALLMEAAGTAVPRQRLMSEVWDAHWHGSTKTLDVHVANLRRKLADAGDRWDRITTVRGYGYRCETEP